MHYIPKIYAEHLERKYQIRHSRVVKELIRLGSEKVKSCSAVSIMQNQDAVTKQHFNFRSNNRRPSVRLALESDE